MENENLSEVTKPKIIQEKPIVYTFTCKKCGSHTFRTISLHTHKFGGPGLGNSKVNVCTNCGWGDAIID